jgi:hypothetical protein
MRTLFNKIIKPSAFVLCGSFFLQVFMQIYEYTLSGNEHSVANLLMEFVNPSIGDFSYNTPISNITGPVV